MKRSVVRRSMPSSRTDVTGCRLLNANGTGSEDTTKKSCDKRIPEVKAIMSRRNLLLEPGVLELLPTLSAGMSITASTPVLIVHISL